MYISVADWFLEIMARHIGILFAPKLLTSFTSNPSDSNSHLTVNVSRITSYTTLRTQFSGREMEWKLTTLSDIVIRTYQKLMIDTVWIRTEQTTAILAIKPLVGASSMC